MLEGAAADTLAQNWQGTLQWVCASPVRPKHPRKNWYIGIFRLPEKPEMPSESEIEFQTCRSGGKGGQHVNKTESAVRATHKASGISVRVESERSQHANKKRALELLAHKLAEHQTAQNADYAKQQHSGLYQVERGNPKSLPSHSALRLRPAVFSERNGQRCGIRQALGRWKFADKSCFISFSSSGGRNIFHQIPCCRFWLCRARSG